MHGRDDPDRPGCTDRLAESGRRTKGEVLQRAAQDQGHPDPMVAGVAVGFARWERGYPRWIAVVMALGLVVR